MFSVPPATVGFDPRLTEKFFEPPPLEQAESSSNTLTNISDIRAEAAAFIFAQSIKSIVTEHRDQALMTDRLINYYSPVLNFRKLKILADLNAVDYAKLESIQDGLLLTLKNQLNLEFLLFFILEKKIGYNQRVFQGAPKNLLLLFNKVYTALEFIGQDIYFKKPVDFTREVINTNTTAAKFHEIYSHLITSLMIRLTNRGYLTLQNRYEPVTKTATACIMANCKTMTLIYVMETNQRTPLLTYLQQPGKKNCDKVIEDDNLLFELIALTPAPLKLAVWQNSFTEGHLQKIIKSPAVFEKLVGLFSRADQAIVRAQFKERKFLHFDPGLTAQFFIAVPRTVSGNEYSLPQLLMMVRRGMLAQKLRDMLSNLEAKYQNKKAVLVNAILNFFAFEVGIDTSEPLDQQELADVAIKQLLVEFGQQAIELLKLSNVIEYIYQTRLKLPLENLTFIAENSVNSGLISSKLNFYGTDDNFSPLILFDEECAATAGEYKPLSNDEIEHHISISLVHRLANSGYADLNQWQKLIFNEHTIYFLPHNSVKIAFVNDERVPLVTFLLGLSDTQIAEILLKFPALLSVLDYFPVARHKSFFLSVDSRAHLFIENFSRLDMVLLNYSIQSLAKFFNNVTTDFLKYVLTCAEHYAHLQQLVPIYLMGKFVSKIPSNEFEELHKDHQKFIAFIGKVFFVSQANFISSLSSNYLQNIHPKARDVNNSVVILFPDALKIFFSKLGDKYLQCVYNDANKLFFLGSIIDSQKFHEVCASLSDDHLRFIFCHTMSLMVLTFLKENKLNFIVKLININCPCYQTLFADTLFLAGTLGSIVGQEVSFVRKINIDFLAAAQNYKHFLAILRTFKTSRAQVTFCLRFGDNLTQLITNISEFVQVYILFDEQDKIYFQTETPSFTDYIIQFETMQKQKISALEATLNAVVVNINKARATLKFTTETMQSGFNQLALTLDSQQSKVRSYAQLPCGERLAKTTVTFLETVTMLENAFKSQIPPATDQRFFSRPQREALTTLNANFLGFHYARFLGLLLSKIYNSHQADLVTKTNMLHTQLMRLLGNLQQPQAHNTLLFMVPDNKVENVEAKMEGRDITMRRGG